jgi:peptidoglycan/LPS O-acetylase OafA/YrhL
MDPPGLDDPDYAAFAWGRYRRILRWMALVSAVTAAAAVLILRWSIGEMYWSMGIFTALGIFLTMMTGAALMGLMFLSSGTGHDDQVEDPLKGEIDIGD